MAEFLALYRGRTVSDAELVAVSAEPQIVRMFFRELLGEGAALGKDKKEQDRANVVVPLGRAEHEGD